jgi:hypothetical protein
MIITESDFRRLKSEQKYRGNFPIIGKDTDIRVGSSRQTGTGENSSFRFRCKVMPTTGIDFISTRELCCRYNRQNYLK